MHDGCNSCYIYHLPCPTPPWQASIVRQSGLPLIRLAPEVIARPAAVCNHISQHAGLEDMANSCFLLYRCEIRMPRSRPLLPRFASLFVMDFCVTIQHRTGVTTVKDKILVTFVS
jgi:hypothetical protein